ncbi:MAG TPA: tripartite tricarboxylate transporter substrate binding protein [Burkholderiales bacterium]|nr:tripartite tricarboxylate transporter substrate binding protein [Burkholderiales bacterium]
MSTCRWKRLARGLACGAALAAAAAGASAQSYPAKPVRLIVPLSPGGPSDILGRAMAQKLSEALKQTVFVDNRPGAGATIGTDIAAKSPPDGHTLLLIGVSTLTINATLYPKLPYDTLRDLAPVTILAGAPYILAAHPSLPVKTLRELVALAKARPGELNYASGGAGTGPQMAMEVLKLRTGMNLVHVPYKGTGPALSDLIAGHVHLQMANMIAALPPVKSGKLRAIAVSGAKRSPVLPEAPTIAESGVPGFEEVGGHMVLVPAGTPRAIIARLHQEFLAILHAPEVKARLAAEGAEVMGIGPAEAAAIVRNDIEKWARIIRHTGIRAN